MWRVLILFFMLVAASVAAATSSCTVKGIALGNIMSGVVHCDHQNMSSLMANGPVTINSGHFGEVRIHGPLHSKMAEFRKEVMITGPASFDHDTFKANVSVVGVIECKGSHFNRSIELVSDRSHFNACTMQSLTMKNNDSLTGMSKLFVKNNSIVHGDIIFKGRPGVVYLSADSHVMGRITNGEIKIVS